MKWIGFNDWLIIRWHCVSSEISRHILRSRSEGSQVPVSGLDFKLRILSELELELELILNPMYTG